MARHIDGIDRLVFESLAESSDAEEAAAARERLDEIEEVDRMSDDVRRVTSGGFE